MFASIRNTSIVLTIAAAGLAIAPAQGAALPDGQRSVVVGHADLDLASPGGVSALQGRVRRAVKAVCGSADTRDLAAMRARSDCRLGAMQAAQPRIEVAIAHARGDTRLASAEPAITVGAQ